MPAGLNSNVTKRSCSAPVSFWLAANSRIVLLSYSHLPWLRRFGTTAVRSEKPDTISCQVPASNTDHASESFDIARQSHRAADQDQLVIPKLHTGDAGKDESAAPWPFADYKLLKFGGRGNKSFSSKSFSDKAFNDGPKSDKDHIFARTPQYKWFCWWTGDGRASCSNQRPWLHLLGRRHVDTRLRLDQEIKAFEKYITPTSKENAAVEKLIARVKEQIAAVAPNNEVFLHGSRYTKLANPLSDIDFCISLPEYEKDPLERGPSASRPEAQAAKKKLLRTVMSAIKPTCRVSTVEFVHARVDIVQAIDAATGIRLQISTLAPFLPSREYTLNYLAEYPGLRPLFQLLRHALLIREHVDVYEGGLGSYPLLIMIVTALKNSPQPIQSSDLGEQLLHVLSFWSKAHLRSNAYSVEPPRVYPKGSMKMSTEAQTERLNDPHLRAMDRLRAVDPTKPWLLCLQDPGNPENDLGRRTTQIREIQKLFMTAYVRIHKLLNHWDWVVLKGYQENKVYKDHTFLDPLVRANYGHFEMRRAMPGAEDGLGLPQKRASFSGEKKIRLTRN